MKRYKQKLDDILGSLSPIETSWKDAHSAAVENAISEIPQKAHYGRHDIARILDADFEAAQTTIRLVLGMSKDEFLYSLKETLGTGGVGITRYRAEPDVYLGAIQSLGFLEAISDLTSKKVTWRDILLERLKYGRGSAIKGQKRGRSLEDFTDEIVARVFNDVGYEMRCRFIGATGKSTETVDFAVPSKEEPRILIESKGYGATGSKQSDILGVVSRVTAEKRHDTNLLLVTDGVTWRQRVSDLRKLVVMQNQGRIARIYTRNMAAELEKGLRQLREDHSL